MKVFIERCAGLDAHSEMILTCVIIGGQNEEILKETETFPTLAID